MNKEQSVASSIEDLQSETTTQSRQQRTLRHQRSSVSIKSVSEIGGGGGGGNVGQSQIDTESLVSGQPILTSSDNNQYDETFETERTNESHAYSETFETSSSSDHSDSSDSIVARRPHTLNKQHTNKIKAGRPASASSLLESISSDLGDQTISYDNKKVLSQLRTTDYLEYIKHKVEMYKNKTNNGQATDKPAKVKCHSTQITRLVRRAINWQSDSQRSENKSNDFKINPYLVNKLRAKHLIKKINKDQMKKIENYGQDVRLTDEDKEQAYYRSKLERIKYVMSKREFEKNETNFCDGILKIGELARDLPKLSDNPDLIWNKLLKPLNDLKVKK